MIRMEGITIIISRSMKGIIKNAVRSMAIIADIITTENPKDNSEARILWSWLRLFLHAVILMM